MEVEGGNGRVDGVDEEYVVVEVDVEGFLRVILGVFEVKGELYRCGRKEEGEEGVKGGVDMGE